MFSNAFITLLLLIVNFVFLLFALSFIIVGIHIVLDHGLILEITNGSIYLTGIYILIFCGFIMFITICIGVYGSIKGDRFMLIAFIVLMIILILFHLIGGILLLAFPSSINDDTKNAMRSTLRDQYGKMKLYTDAWNLTQNKLRCCGVDDLGWSIYRGSYWDNVTNIELNNRELRLDVSNPFYKIIPISCCWTLIDTQTGWPSQTYMDVNRCQYFQFGPPNLDSGANNAAVNYRGCANAMKSFMGMYSRGVGGLAIFFVFVLVVGIVLVIVKLRHSSKAAKENTHKSSEYLAAQDDGSEYPPEAEQKIKFIPSENRDDEEDDIST